MLTGVAKVRMLKKEAGIGPPLASFAFEVGSGQSLKAFLKIAGTPGF